MLKEFLNGLFHIYVVLSDEGRKHLDDYCTGMIFGLQGSKMLVRIANTLINPVDSEGNIIPTNIDPAERRKRMGSKGQFDVMGGARNFLQNMG